MYPFFKVSSTFCLVVALVRHLKYLKIRVLFIFSILKVALNTES